MLQFLQMHWTTVLCGVGAAMFALLALIFGLKAYNGHKRGRSRKVVFRRVATTFVFAALMMCCLIGCTVKGDTSGDGVSNPGDTSQGETPPADPPETPPVEPLPDVNLTKNQIDAFLKDYDLTFDDSSLTSHAQARIEAWAKFGSSMTDGLSFPYNEEIFGEVYDPDLQKLMDNIKKLSDANQLALFKTLRHEIYQDIVSNPVIGIAWLELFSQNDLIMENNSYWITPNLEIIDQLYAGTYKAPKASDPDYAEKMQIELNNLPEPTDVTCRGLDYLLVYNGGHIEVRQTWARLAARICAILDYFDIQGVTQRESSIHWHLLPTAEDSMVRPTKATYKESEPAIKLVYAQKDNNEAITYGSNTLDRRPMEYQPNVKEPTKAPDPGKGSPEDPGEPEKPPVTPKTEYGTLTIRYVDDTTGQLLTGTSPNPYTQSVKVGEKYSRTSPVIPGYTLKDQSLSTVSSNRFGMMTKSGVTVTVPYVPAQATTHKVTVKYLYEDGTNVYDPKSYTLEKDKAIDEYAKPCPRNYWVSPEEWHGKMGDKDVEIIFTYHYLYLPNWKDPSKDPVNQGNADVGGGSNLPTDGTGEYQPTEPPRTDYPEQGSGTTSKPGSNRPDYDPSTGNSNVPLTPNDKHESSGQGGDALDHEIKDANGGHTDNGKPPEKDPIDVTHGTTVTDPGTSSGGGSSSSGASGGSGGTTTNTSDEPVNQGSIAEPD